MPKREKIRSVTGHDVAAMASEPEGVSTLPETSGSPDKDGAVAAESAPPKVKTFTVEGRLWMEQDPHGLTTEGIYGKKGQTALQPEDLQQHAQFLGAPLGVEQLETIHGVDDTAPKDGVTCPICDKPVTSFVRTALIDRTTGDLVHDRDTGNVVYRGQFVAVGPDAMDLKVHGAHPGECLFKLRIRRDRNGNAMQEEYVDNRGIKRQKWLLLDTQSFDQANVRVVAVKLSILAKRDERASSEAATRARLGFKVGDAAAAHTGGGGHRTDDGFDRGAFAPKTPRGQSRKQQRWVDEDDPTE